MSCPPPAADGKTWSPRPGTPAAARSPWDRACRYARPFAARNRRRTFCTAVFEVMPDGLSSSSTPSSETPLFGPAGAVGSGPVHFFRLLRFASSATAASISCDRRHSALDRGIVLEMQLGYDADLHALRELAAQEPRRMLQARRRPPRCGAAVPEHREEDLGMGVVRSHFDVGDGDHADARILELKPDDVGQLALNLLGDAAAAGEISWHGRARREELGARRQAPGGYPPHPSRLTPHKVLATSTTSYTSSWSPTLRSSKFLSESPHSNPALTSRTSSLKRLRESSSPS